MNIEEVVKSILNKHGVNVSNLNENDSMTSLGLDSLDLVEVMLDIEDELKVEFSSDEIADLKYLKDMITLIQKKLK